MALFSLAHFAFDAMNAGDEPMGSRLFSLRSGRK
jgi:hypothetical protein